MFSFDYTRRTVFALFTSLFIFCTTLVIAAEQPLDLDIISYEDLIQETPQAMQILRSALHEKGIVGVKNIPGYGEKVAQFIETARKFSALSDEDKIAYSPNHEHGEFLGYDQAKEQFKRPDGRWVVDDLKTSYYALVPDAPENKWPSEIDVKTPFQELGSVMSHVGEIVMEKVNLLGKATGISIDGVPRVGRMLYYKKNSEQAKDNPYWCGAHFDHSLFTALIPAFYFLDGYAIQEPVEAGLYVKPTGETVFKKVAVNDPEIMLFQVGEFSQLVSDDAICATEHRVHKAQGNIERYTMALFFSAPSDTIIHSQSVLTQDARYGGKRGDPCTSQHWHTASLDRYRVTK